MKSFLVPVIVLAALAFLPGPPPAWAQQGGASAFQAYQKPMPLPEFSLEDLSGKIVRSQDSRGSVLLLHFWATW